MTPADIFTFICPVKTNSGNRALEHLPLELANLNAFKPLVVTSIEAVGRKAVRTLTDAFGDSGMTFGLFDGITDAADLALVDDLKKTCLEKQYDAIIALGDGVVTDAAKILNLAVSLKTADARQLSPETPIRKPLAPLAAVPTAAANGLETSPSAHLNKMAFSSEYLAPNLVVLDPRLTRAKDAKTVAATGLAAFGRALEAHIGADANPFRAAYSFAAIRFIKENLPTAVEKPDDAKASLAVLNAAAMSGCAFSHTDNVLLHKLGQVFHDILHIHPGIVIGLGMPYILGDYSKKNGVDLTALFLPLAGEDASARTPSLLQADEALDILNRFLANLQSTLGKDMPRTLREAGVPAYMLDDILDVLATDRDGPYLCAVVKRMWDEAPLTSMKG